MKKPKWVVQKEQQKKAASQETIWLFGIHAVQDALRNPQREKLRLVVSKNAADKLAEAIAVAGTETAISEPRSVAAPLDTGSVPPEAALEVAPLHSGRRPDAACVAGEGRPPLGLLEYVTAPHHVGGALGSAEVFGANAVIGTQRHSAPETGALAKTASGALERQPYLRLRNLSDTIIALQEMGYWVIGLDGEANLTIEQASVDKRDRPLALVLGAEGPGLRQRTKETVNVLARIQSAKSFGSLNVSNAAAVSLYSLQS